MKKDEFNSLVLKLIIPFFVMCLGMGHSLRNVFTLGISSLMLYKSNSSLLLIVSLYISLTPNVLSFSIVNTDNNFPSKPTL